MTLRPGARPRQEPAFSVYAEQTAGSSPLKRFGMTVMGGDLKIEDSAETTAAFHELTFDAATAAPA